MNQTGQAWRSLLLGALLIGATVATYWPVLENDFINYDDPDYVTANEVVKRGLTWNGVQWAFATGHASNWHPVTWLSHMLDVSWFGLRPAGHHATNLFLHVANTLLLWRLLLRMTGSLWRSALVAGLFALHPLHVESVAWVAERKDVLSTFFGLLTLLAYVRFAQCKIQNSKFKIEEEELGRGGQGKGQKAKGKNLGQAWYVAALVFYALGLMSKPMLVTWPFVMLLLDYWPLRRIDLPARGFQLKALKQLVLEKLPFLLLATISSVVTVVVQHGAMAKTEIVPVSDRLGNAILAYTSYLQQTVWPAKLAAFYPFPPSFPPAALTLALAILSIITALGVRHLRPHPFVMIGWLWFLGTLIPVIGLVQVGAQARADRYTYLPLIGIFMALSWSLPFLAFAGPRRNWIISTAAVGVLIALGVTSRMQIQHWRDDRALWAHAIEATTENHIAWSGLGIADVKDANWSSAMTNLSRAYEYAKPHHTERSVSYYLGVTLQMQGKPLEALPYLEACVVPVELRPERDHRLGLSLMATGRLAEAESALRSAFTAQPGNLNYQLGLAALYQAKGDFPNADAVHREAILAHPDASLAAKAYGDFLTSANRHVEAVAQYESAVKLKPADAAYRRVYADGLRRAGEFKIAVAQLEAAFQLQPPTTPDLLELAETYAQLGQPRSVLDCYDRAIKLDPDSVPALNNLAWFLATNPDDGLRNGDRAVVLADEACRLTEWKSAILMGTLAAAYAEAGRFSEAVMMADKAIATARADKQDEVAKRNAELRELYRGGKPYRDK